MATNYPTSIDSFTNPTSGDTLDSPSHAAQHANINDAMVAVQTKLGVGSGTISTWTAFTPSWENLTVGNATQDFHYAQINEVLHIVGKLTFGSTTSITGAFIRFASPVGNITSEWVGQTNLGDAGTATRQGICIASSNNVLIQSFAVSGSVINAANVSATVPHTWTTNDTIRVSLTARIL